MTSQTWTWTPETPQEEWVKAGLVVPRKPDCVSWCLFHCVLDDGTSFCMGPDIRTPRTSNGYVGLQYEDTGNGGRAAWVDLGNGNDTVSVEQAEEYARAILAQVARARGEEEQA